MEKQECAFFHDGECEKYRKHGNCRQFDIGDFESFFGVMDMSEVCAAASIYGNRLILITEEDIEELRNGKVLSFLDEYGIFIAMDKGDKE